MTVPALSVSPEPPLTIAADVLVLGVSKTDDGPRLLSDAAELAELQLVLASIGVTGAQDELRRIPGSYGATESIALIGVGSGEVTVDDLRYAAGSAARQLRGVESIVFALPVKDDADTLAVLEGAAIGAYAYTEYRSSSLESTKLPATTVIVAAAGSDALVSKASIIAEAVHTVRDLVNMPPSDLYPESFARWPSPRSSLSTSWTRSNSPRVDSAGFSASARARLARHDS